MTEQRPSTGAGRPEALVLFESCFGNTAAVAKAVTDGLARAGWHVEVREFADLATHPPLRAPDLTVAGGPTHAFSMSRVSTRADAERQGAVLRDRLAGLREWLTHQPPSARGQRVAFFDTRVERVRRLPGSAAGAAARLARKRGLQVVSRASFFVHDTSGPLAVGELDRARQWGEELASGVRRDRHGVGPR